ncbi:amino acid ABC transporter permease [Sediminivirga luteola]|uniref:amino acid ABC transporter permease n=1 Tax=Sediminivirga luteola TaxID=1774748 RepID=UPI001F5AA093|nr:amino acid ABC transporter permease [Sediminivirga luteola]
MTIAHTAPEHPLLRLPRRRRSRVALIVVNAIVAALLVSLVLSAAFNPRFHWDTVASYFFEVRILRGIGITLFMTAAVMAMSMVAGTVIALLRMSPSGVLAGAAAAFIWVFRSIPMLVLLLFAYNLAALYPTLFGMDTNAVITPLSAALIALTLHQSAYVAELVRAGLLSISAGQHEAAAALGMGKGLAFFRVVLPQAMRVIIPPLGNEVISLLKATSLVSVISLSDLLYSVQLIYAKNYQTIPLLIVACLWYMIITGLLTLVQQRIERRLSRHHRAANTTKIEAKP